MRVLKWKVGCIGNWVWNKEPPIRGGASKGQSTTCVHQFISQDKISDCIWGTRWLHGGFTCVWWLHGGTFSRLLFGMCGWFVSKVFRNKFHWTVSDFDGSMFQKANKQVHAHFHGTRAKWIWTSSNSIGQQWTIHEEHQVKCWTSKTQKIDKQQILQSKYSNEETQSNKCALQIYYNQI